MTRTTQFHFDPMNTTKRKRWSEEDIAVALVEIHARIGRMPSHTYLKEVGRGDLSNQICKRGGFLAWADRLGFKREHSDSDTGWDGEKAVENWLRKHFKVERQGPVKWPFDLLVDGVLRIDVKAARFATYGHCSGWFYRIGKAPQADLLALHQLDEGSTFFIPWTIAPHTNITISRGGGRWARFENNIEIVRSMASRRSEEWRQHIGIREELYV